MYWLDRPVFEAVPVGIASGLPAMDSTDWHSSATAALAQVPAIVQLAIEVDECRVVRRWELGQVHESQVAVSEVLSLFALHC